MSKSEENMPMLASLKKYLEETPIEAVRKEWNEIVYKDDAEELNVSIDEYVEMLEKGLVEPKGILAKDYFNLSAINELRRRN